MGITKKLSGNKFLRYAVIAFALILSSCNEILNLYVNPDIQKYSVQRIALLPMKWDDTTDEGTYYSTNHFVNKIYNERSDIDLADIDTLRAADCSEVLKMFEEIGDRKTINVKEILSSSIGSYLIKSGCDAILAGTIDSTWVSERVIYDGNNEWAHTDCVFNYYMFSLKDGQLLWEIHMIGSEKKYVSKNEVMFPALDEAISSGIDYFFDKFTFKKNGK